MKKYILLFFVAIAGASLLTTSCKKVSGNQVEAIESRLANDVAFKNTLTAAAEMGTSWDIAALSNESNLEELKTISSKINTQTATAAYYARVEAITGVSYESFISGLQKFALSLNELNKAYPELGKMDQNKLSATFTKAIQLNPELQSFVNNPAGAVLRGAACPLRDICNLAVVLVKLFAGDTICAAISVSTIPVVGGILCQLVLNLGVGILTGICNALPC